MRRHIRNFFLYTIEIETKNKEQIKVRMRQSRFMIEDKRYNHNHTSKPKCDLRRLYLLNVVVFRMICHKEH